MSAIFHHDDLPAEWKHYTRIDREFFEAGISGIGAPGGAVQYGTIGYHHPDVAAVPPLEEPPTTPRAK